ncbi:MAG: N-acetylmuramoyl-L-alanine amidase [Nocardioidaceae bacterium]|nr:N-acetylmuramoyl-L-alanine amidase [Nocardioidaceae bacterium]NUS49563.1 N-acetylmuramoyl-L-alanine amidase [Nocardioidaceae bacterium]
MTNRRKWAAATTVAALVGSGFAALVAPQAQAADWGRCLAGPADRQAVFDRAAQVSGVPEKVLLAVSYMESRWDDHGAKVSSAGGYGVMHLTQDAAVRHAAKVARLKGDGAAPDTTVEGTLTRAADLTGIPARRLRSDDVANVCGGAAVLASYRDGSSSRLSDWSAAVGRYSGSRDATEQRQFAAQVFRTLRTGAARTTDDGQRVTLAATPGATAAPAAPVTTGDDVVDCPPTLACELLPAPYQQTGSDPGDYGNHDLADRPANESIDYIVIHDTEADYPTTIKLVQDPTYLGWHYSIRSEDGHVAQHINPKNVGWHAGNWYVNAHSIGIEHEGFAATGATWYTESMYQSSATLVRHLATKYGVPLDRAHVIGHDQVPGITSANIPGMHWDPGPYWNWEHYMALLGAPLGPDRHTPSDVVTVAPGFADNPQPLTNCASGDGTSSDPCRTQGTNFVYLRTAPSDDAPLVEDPGLHQDGTASSTEVSDIGPRLTAGQKVVVAKRQGGWIATWWLGELGWFKATNAAGESVVKPSQGVEVSAVGTDPVPVYGRAYPEQAAYAGTGVPYQAVSPLLYRIKPGQRYVLADAAVPTDYYRATTYDWSSPRDGTAIVGGTRYYEIWFGHRVAFVQAEDVTLH